MCIRLGRMFAVALVACVCAGAVANADDGTARASAPVGATDTHFETFLDRLMRAESNGRAFAANPRSTALGPFQFIKATFIDVARRHFPDVALLSDEEVLTLRTDHAYARRAAAIYSLENLAYLSGMGLKPSPGDLRLAFLVGPSAAARLMQAHPQTPASDILGAPAIRANPFMLGMSASDLIARSVRDVAEHRHANAQLAPALRERPSASSPAPRVASRPGVPELPAIVRCNRKLVACKRWIAMQANKLRVAHQPAVKRAETARKAVSRS